MFNLREFIKTGLTKAIGKMADYQIILNAAGWFEKGVLLEEDLAEIQTLIEAHNAIPEFSEEEAFDNEELTEESTYEIVDTAEESIETEV